MTGQHTSRLIVGVLVTALVGGAAAWVTWAKETPSQDSVERLIDAKITESHLEDPYRTDAKLLEYRLAQNTKGLEQVKAGMDDLKRDVGEIMGVLKALSKQLDDVSDHLKENDG